MYSSVYTPSLSAAWFGAASFTILIPVFIMTVSRLANSDNDQNNNNNNGNNNNNNNNGDFYGDTPWWYFGGAKWERERDEEKAPPMLIATYIWSLLLFSSIVFCGHRSLQNGNFHGVVVALILFANFALLSMFLYSGVEGAVEFDGPAVDEHGFVGQFGVMMYFTSILWFVYCVTFACILNEKSKSQYVEKVESSGYQNQTETFA